MAVNNKIRALLNMKGKKSHELAEYFGISAQAMRNKLSRNSFSAEDLIKVSEFLQCELLFLLDGKQKVILDSTDLLRDTKKADND